MIDGVSFRASGLGSCVRPGNGLADFGNVGIHPVCLLFNLLDDFHRTPCYAKRSNTYHRDIGVSMSKELYRHILGGLAKGQRLVLATVVARSGSGPREAGASMVVRDGGGSMGTVGGGLLEGQVLAAAKNALQSARPVCLTFSLTAKEVAAGGMLCGGRVEVLVDVLGCAISSVSEPLSLTIAGNLPAGIASPPSRRL